MSFSPITHLRHVDIAVPDYDKQVEFYAKHWGLATTGDERDVSYFAAEGSPEQYNVRVRKAAEKRLDLISLGAADRATVDGLAARLGSEGVQLINEPDILQTPGGGYGFRFFDLEGRTIEVSSDVETRKHRKIEEKEDIPVRLSHVVFNSPEPEKMTAWYEKHLNFRLSDTNTHPRMGGLFWFLRCSDQHHSIAISRGPHTALNHVSFELRGLDEYLYGSGRLMRAGIPKIWGPGGTAPVTTPSRTSTTPTATLWSTPPSSPPSTRTPGTPASTTSPIRQPPICGGSRRPRTSGSASRCSTTPTRASSSHRPCEISGPVSGREAANFQLPPPFSDPKALQQVS